jgi:hypothetical protein
MNIRTKTDTRQEVDVGAKLGAVEYLGSFRTGWQYIIRWIREMEHRMGLENENATVRWHIAS